MKNKSITMRLTVKVLLLLSSITISSSAISENVYKIEDMTFLGVSLGDTAEQFIKGFTEHHSISSEDLIIETVFKDEPKVDLIEYDTDELGFTARFRPKYDPATNPEGENPHVLTLLRVDWVLDDYEAFANDAKKQYGAPSISMGSFFIDIWCGKVNAEKLQCAPNTGRLFIDENGAYMEKDYQPL